MKNKVLAAFIFILGSFASATAQNLTNISFETWATDTNYLDLTLPSIHDTAISREPAGWTTTNAITGGNVFHHVNLVTENTTTPKVGSSALQLVTDTVKGTVGVAISIVAPGFVVSGKFPIDLQTFALAAGSGSFNPLTLAGAGVAVNGRKGSIGGYVKYTPQGGDTAYVVALLRSGTTVVAQATYKHATNDAGYIRFDAPFVYSSCVEPDTLVYVISSGNPFTYNNLINQQPTGLHEGSLLLIDSVYVSDTLLTFAVPPIAVNDAATTLKNTAVTIPVTVNDVRCYTGALGVTVSTQPANGTTTVSGDSIIYTPATGFVGVDSFYYTATIGGSAPSSPAQTRINVTAPTSVLDIAEGLTSVYPNPAKDKLHISTTNTAIANVAIYDIIGNLVKTDAIRSALTVDLSAFHDGIYVVRFTGSEGKVISSSRFSVVK